LLEGRPVFCYNHLGRTLTRIAGAETLGAQTETVAVRFDYAGGFGGGHFTLTVDGRAVADGAVERTQRGMYSMNEQFDIGRNRGSAVAPDFADRRPFACTAPLESVTVDLAAAPGVSTLEEYRIALATHCEDPCRPGRPRPAGAHAPRGGTRHGCRPSVDRRRWSGRAAGPPNVDQFSIH